MSSVVIHMHHSKHLSAGLRFINNFLFGIFPLRQLFPHTGYINETCFLVSGKYAVSHAWTRRKVQNTQDDRHATSGMRTLHLE
jgi:hypothetical protein